MTYVSSAAGVFCAPFALEIYADIFDRLGALDRFEAFASLNGPRFYGLPPNAGTVTLERADTIIPDCIGAAVGGVKPFRAGETIRWRMVEP